MTPRPLPVEWRKRVDPVTSAVTVQWTTAPAMNHHLYFTNPSTTDDGRFGFFVSYRTGYPNLFQIALADGSLLQLTDRTDINAFSFCAEPAGEFAYFSARQSVYALSRSTDEVSEIGHFPGARLGICSLSHDGLWLALGLRFPDHCELAVIDLKTRTAVISTQATEIGHVQFCPKDANLIEFSGTVRERIWIHDRAACTTRIGYAQSAAEWIVHETWLGRGDEIVFPHWPYKLCAVRPDGSGYRVLAEVNAWHICSNADGTRVLCDTVHPDRGLIVVDTVRGSWRTVAEHGASCRGTQWPFDVPAVGAGMDTSIIRSDHPERDPPPTPSDSASTYGPQWSHPHPRWTFDERHAVYTSDRDGWSHVFMTDISGA